MGKFFCPKDKVLTYSLRYVFNEKWEKPKGNPQYCRKCNKTFPQDQCLVGGEIM